MLSVKVTTVGNSLGIVLPRELLQRLRVDKGDQLFLVETRDGVELVPYQPEFAAQVEEMERAARADRDVLRALARPRAGAVAVPLAPAAAGPSDGPAAASPEQGGA